jgi:Tfp pilus assembly protein PilX
MEDILAILLVATAFVAVVGLGKLIVKYRERRQQLAEERAVAIAEAQAALARDRERRNQRIKEALQNNPTTQRKLDTYRKETATKPSYTPSPTQSVKDSDTSDFASGVLTGMLINAVIDSLPHKSGGSNPIDFPKTERTDSWSAPSSSSDSSSSGDSWSSDSGPSSDW